MRRAALCGAILALTPLRAAPPAGAAHPAARVAPHGNEAPDWPEYLRSFHTSDVELRALAARIRPGLLVLTHIVRRGASDAELVAGVRRGGWTGPVAVGHDLERF